MSRDTVRIEVHKNLKDVLDNLRKSVALDMKKKYNLSEIIVPRTLSSQIAAAKIMGIKNLNIRIRKTAINKGILEII